MTLHLLCKLSTHQIALEWLDYFSTNTLVFWISNPCKKLNLFFRGLPDPILVPLSPYPFHKADVDGPELPCFDCDNCVVWALVLSLFRFGITSLTKHELLKSCLFNSLVDVMNDFVSPCQNVHSISSFPEPKNPISKVRFSLIFGLNTTSLSTQPNSHNLPYGSAAQDPSICL